MSKSTDDLSQRLGVLTRREVEARIMAPVLEALGEKFGDEEVRDVVKQTVIDIAKKQGAELANTLGGCGSTEFLASLAYWTQDDALEIDILEQSETTLHFNVNRCRYAEMYNTLGIPELGAILSCNRDFALIEGFNSDADLTRTQTIMGGASHCNFRYKFPDKENT
ncbi:MAG: L-2-amino-thiazoline-4-carboxylic acid hydrolase [Rhodothermales bacterium]